MDIGYASRVIWVMLKRECIAIKKNGFDPIINAVLRVVTVYIGMGMVAYLMGFERSISADVVTGAMVSVFLNRGFTIGIADSYDKKFTRFIDYRRLLPLSTRGLLIAYIVRYMLTISLSTIPLFVTAYVLLPGQVALSAINPFMFVAMLLLGFLFLSVVFITFLFIASFDWLRFNLWQRVLTPSLVLGCNLYSWYKVYAFNPMLARALLLSPIVYLTEGIRAVFIAEGPFIPASYCLLGLGVWTCLLLLFIFGPITWQIDKGTI